MPRVSAAHEQEVRDRILAAAARVFSEKGYHSSTIADVVRESGLSVGAIYTYFSGKDELIRLTCDQIAARGLDELAERLAPATTTAERMAIAIRLYVETIDDYDGAPGQITLVQAWAEADREPGVREMLAARRERLVGAGRYAHLAGDRQRRTAGAGSTSTPSPVASSACSTGSCSSGSRPAMRRVRPTSSGAPWPSSTCCSPPGADRPRSRRPSRRRSIAGHGARPDRPRPDRPSGSRVHPAARAHPDRAVAHRGSLGLLAADPRRAGHPRRSSRDTAPPAGAGWST